MAATNPATAPVRLDLATAQAVVELRDALRAHRSLLRKKALTETAMGQLRHERGKSLRRLEAAREALDTILAEEG